MKTSSVGMIDNYAALQNSFPSKNEQALQNDFSAVLDKAVKSKDNKKLYKACQDLESVFLAKMFETMRSTVPESDFVPKSFASQTFESMLFDEYSQKVSKTSSLGIADMIYRQLTQNQE